MLERILGYSATDISLQKNPGHLGTNISFQETRTIYLLIIR
jgi:hypothetical protein